ncbi:MAG: hypothetical protein RR816_11685, partial [Clostridia bacterium]
MCALLVDQFFTFHCKAETLQLHTLACTATIRSSSHRISSLPFQNHIHHTRIIERSMRNVNSKSQQNSAMEAKIRQENTKKIGVIWVKYFCRMVRIFSPCVWLQKLARRTNAGLRKWLSAALAWGVP